MRNTLIVLLVGIIVLLLKHWPDMEAYEHRLGLLRAQVEKQTLRANSLEGALKEAQDGKVRYTKEDLCLAQAMFSEAPTLYEASLVGWIIRNRVEAGFRGETTYCGVVLDPYQFSAFNPGNPKRKKFLALTADSWVRNNSETARWRSFLRQAYRIRRDPAGMNPVVGHFHFYSPVSMDGGRTPAWAFEMEPVFRVDDKGRIWTVDSLADVRGSDRFVLFRS